MTSTKRYRTRSTARSTQPSTPRSSIQRYFGDSQRVTPGAIVTAPRVQSMAETDTLELPASPTSSTSLDCFSETPVTLQAVMAGLSQRLSGIPEDLRIILQTLPTKVDIEALPSRADIESLILRVEEAHNREIQEIREEIHGLTEWVESSDTSILSLTQWVSALERSQASQTATAIDLQLHLEDLEDHSRRNNLRLRGITEATGAEDLAVTVTAIFQTILGNDPPQLELDRVHRTLGPKSADLDRPRDVLCRLHRYTQKELILRKAWDHGELEFDGATIKILPDLSRGTLQRRALLRPALELARRKGYTYRWGYPLAVTFRNGATSCTLHTPAELPDFFDFLEVELVAVSDWLAFVPRPAGRPGPTAQRNHQPPRQQRSRRRHRMPSN